MDFIFKGKCRTLGCDGVENSTSVDDECGVCGGNGTSCLRTKLHFRKAIKRGWEYNVLP